MSESTVRKVLAAEGLVLPGNPPREPIPRSPWPDWLEWKPNRVWGYDFTHFTRAKRCAVAIIDIVSRKWITTLVSAEESSIQVEVAFTEALEVEDLWAAADQRATAALVTALASGDAQAMELILGDGQRPLLLAISDNGPQMRSHTTREFLAGVAIAQQFGRPGTPQDQAWIETLFGHVKSEWPHLEKITDPGELAAELDLARADYNGVRLHAGLQYVTPNDEHEGRGDAIRGQTPRWACSSTPEPHRLPSNHRRCTPRRKPMSTPHPWLGISTGDWLINSNTPHGLRGRGWGSAGRGARGHQQRSAHGRGQSAASSRCQTPDHLSCP